jgi:hypothetical protein
MTLFELSASSTRAWLVSTARQDPSTYFAGLRGAKVVQGA